MAHPESTGGIDRNDPHAAQAVVERLLDPADRQPFLLLLRELILIAHAVGAGVWSLTLSSNGQYVRLNVSKMEVCALYRHQVRLVLDATTLTAEQRYTVELYALLNGSPTYKTVASSMLCDFLPEHLGILLPLLQPSSHTLIQLAARTVKHRTNLAQYHSPGLIGYIRNATGLQCRIQFMTNQLY